MLYGDGIHDDSAALQALLDRRGIVTVDRPGTYLISRTLIIHSNTLFLLSPGARILAAPFSRCAVIENERFAGGGRDERIRIVGGIFDGNCDEMGLDAEYEAIHREDQPYSPGRFKGKLMRFAHVDNLALEQLTVRNPVSYGIQIADACGFLVRDVTFDYNWHFGTTDGVHINGPARDGVIENLHGTTNDDMVGMTTIDETHAEVTVGEIAQVSIRNVCAENGYSGVRLLSAGGFAMRDIHICGVYGTYRHNAVLVSHHNTRPNTPIWFDDLIIEQIHASKSPTPLGEGCFRFWEKNAILKNPVVWFEKGIEAGSVILRDVTRDEHAATVAPLVQLDAGAHIRRMVMENLSQTLAEGIEAPLIVNEATIDHLITRD